MGFRAALAVLALAAVPAVTEAAIILVPKDQPTIQAAIDAAQAGDTIVVSKGKYDEDVVVAGRTDLTIQGLGKVTLRPVTIGMRIDGSARITVAGFSVTGGETGFLVVGSQDVTIGRFSVRSVTEDGIEAMGSSGVHLADGKISGCGSDGISFADSDPGTPVTSSDITNVKIKDCVNDGIDVLGSDIVVSRCSVADARDDGFESDDRGAGPVRFENCKVKDAGSDGFNLGAPASTAFQCSSTASDDDGFDVEGAGSRVESCTSKKSKSNGFQMEVDGATLLACQAIGSARNGYDLTSVTNSRLENCTAKTSREDGFYLDVNSSLNTLVGNSASKSREFDLDDESAGDNTFQSNTFKTSDPN